MKRILIAEDDAPSRELLREILELEGYQVIEAADGSEALTKFRETTPDLVLLDIRMPVVGGLAVLSQLRQDEDFSKVPAIALTAYAMDEDRARVLAAGFDGYASKPVDGGRLIEQIRQCLAEEN